MKGVWEVIHQYIIKYKKLPVQIKASFWFLISSFLQKGITSITTPVFTRLLSTVEYGRFNVFNSWMGIITIFVTLNLSAGVYAQGLVKFEKERDRFSSVLQGLTFTLVAVWTIVYLLTRSFWNSLFSLTTVQMLAMLLMMWTSAVFNFWATEQRVRLSYIKLVVITIIVSIAKPVIGILFVVYAEDKVTARILGLALVEIIGYFGLFVSQMRRGKKFFSFHFWMYAIKFSLPLIPHYLSQTVLSSADRIMIKNMVGEAEAGIYSLAYSVSMVMTLLNSALGYTISPWIYRKIRDKQSRDIEPIAYFSLVLIAVANVTLIAFAPEIIAIFAPRSYYKAIWVIPPVAMSVFFMFAYDLFAKFEFYYEKTQFIMFASITAAILNIILNYIFIEKYGYRAAGYTTLFCYIIYTIGHFAFMRRVNKTCMEEEQIYNVKVLLVIAVSFLACGFSFLPLYKYIVIRYVFAVCICVYAVLNRNRIIKYFKIIRNK